ncbi:MAG: FAD-dependent oxidoreductase, partial [Planctomycetes bacterium]|nr:FAD-dependent oxidoreductase [Planctomycetota bacterium]
MTSEDKLAKQSHKVDFCVVGGGLSGMCAAIAAARHGAKVVLMQDRPVLGGNASSEIRMWVSGAHGKDTRETGIVHEIELENDYRNPTQNYSIWDSILFEKVKYEDNITLLLNCSCNDLEMEGSRIRRIKGWQLTSETWQTVEANLFADCSGDSILAPLSGAEFRIGREAADEFDEDIEPPVADKRTMGMSCLIQARETDRPQTFTPPTWANKYLTDDDLPHRGHGVPGSNFWWIELGGEYDSIHDSEMLRDELLKVAFGVWDHIKNHGDHGVENWVLDWVGFLPGKRESRRYVGDHIITQNDVRAEGRFDDLVAYGGWSMDDHHPGGMAWPGKPTMFHPAPSPYGIPYRSLYSK